MTKPTAVPYVWMLSVACAACAGGDDGGSGGLGAGGGATCSAALAKFRTCGLVESPELDLGGCRDSVREDRRCIVGCVANASCADLMASLCSSGSPDAEFVDDSPVGECQSACRNQHEYVCADGSDPIDGAQRCDGLEECDDAADEQDCPMVACGDGTEVVEDYRCDGLDDCLDGSDEMGCASFSCGNGSTIAAFERCDGSEDCADGSDELDCATLTCG